MKIFLFALATGLIITNSINSSSPFLDMIESIHFLVKSSKTINNIKVNVSAKISYNFLQPIGNKKCFFIILWL